MPVPAAGLADVVVRDLDPAEAVGLRDHRLEQAAVRLLDVGAAGDLALSLAQPVCERVANSLELRDREDPRPADRADMPVDVLTREGAREELGEPALENPDLAAKLFAGEALGARGNGNGRKRLANDDGRAVVLLE